MTLNDAIQGTEYTTGVRPLSPSECQNLMHELRAGRPIDPELAARLVATFHALMLVLGEPESYPSHGPLRPLKI